MVKKTLLGATVRHLLDELSPEIPEEKESQIENEVSKKLETVLGKNWAALPVTGSYMMIVVLILNYILLPMGVTPVTVADKVISKSKEYQLDSKFNELLLSARANATATGEFTAEKISELTKYSEQKGRQLGDVLIDALETGQRLGKSVLDRSKEVSKGVLSNLKSRVTANDEATEVDVADEE